MSIEVRSAETDADFEGWIRVKRAVFPNESAWTVQEFRERQEPDQLVVVAVLGGEVVGAGLAGPSDVQGRGFVAPRVHPDARRRGVGTAMLHRLTEHVAGLGFDKAWASVDDDGSRAFAERFGFREVDREVEQVVSLPAELPAAPLPDGVEVMSIAYRPELLREAYALAQDEGYADMAIDGNVVIPLDVWLRDEATEPGGTRFVQGETFRGVMVPLLRRTLERDARRGFEMMNDALKRRAEGSRVPSSGSSWPGRRRTASPRSSHGRNAGMTACARSTSGSATCTGRSATR